jgi:RNA polymerase sigma factor (sigma-70 family)
MNELAPLQPAAQEAAGQPVEITAITRLKHAELYRLSQGMADHWKGGQSKLARTLGMSAVELGRWINMHECPPTVPTRAWPESRLAKLEVDLMRMTGKTLEELFPQTLRESVAFLAGPKRFEQTAFLHAEALERYAIATADRIRVTHNASLSMEREEESEAIAASLQAIPLRERQMVEMFYGLGGFQASTLEEIGKAFGLTRERVRQLIERAVRRLQRQPKIALLRDDYEAAS